MKIPEKLPLFKLVLKDEFLFKMRVEIVVDGLGFIETKPLS